ncbi:hypothetical protein LIER_39974 [Lithospermum erythrorhizon]|uniref:Uncharacterized protein n=1 Tax=Lithospermum erythrorhizon TaxID=34254 RepID=A0AAV3QQV0_LITER
MSEELNGKILAGHLDPELLVKAANVEKDYKTHSRIIEMKYQEDNLVREYEGVKQIIVNFYEKLFSALEESSHIEERVGKLVNRSITEGDVLRLSSPVTEKEIENTMLSMKRGKALILMALHMSFVETHGRL